MMSGFDLEMIQTFRQESMEHLDSCERELLELETRGKDKALLDSIFRSIHTIKGGAGFLSLNTMNNLAHVMEEILSAAREASLDLTDQHISLLLEGLDLIKSMFEDLENSDEMDVSSIVNELNKALKGSVVETSDFAFPTKENLSSVFAGSVDQVEKLLKENSREYLYFIGLRPGVELKECGEEFIPYLKGLMSQGEIIIDSAGVFEQGELKEESSIPEEFYFVIATDMDDHLAPILFSVGEENFLPIEREELIKNLKSSQTSTDTVREEDPATLIQVEESPEILQSPTPVKKPTTESGKEKLLYSDLKPIRTSSNMDTLRIRVEEMNRLVSLAGELVLNRNQIVQAFQEVTHEDIRLAGAIKRFSSMTTDLQSLVIGIRMMPISSLLGKFPRVVKDLSNQLDKKVEVRMEGTGIELDKTMIEALSDPLTHLIRNVVDHGIEAPQTRIENGKPETGMMHIRAYHESGMVILEINDDGGGIDGERVSQKAIEKGVISPERVAAMGEQEKINLIFTPGFSTKEEASSVSGRGVGMDVVRTNIEGIGGTIQLESQIGKGTKVILGLPLTLAIENCLIVGVEDKRYVIPQANIQELMSFSNEDALSRIESIQGQRILRLRGELLPLLYLLEYLDMQIPEITDSSMEISILVVAVGSNRLGILVDEIVSMEEIVVKPVPEFMEKLPEYAGCSILGDGMVAPILDVARLVRSHLDLGIQKSYRDYSVGFDQTGQGKVLIESLICRCDPMRPYAIELEKVAKIETIRQDTLEVIGSQNYFKFDGNLIPVVMPSDFGGERLAELTGEYSVVLIQSETFQFGVLAQEIQDCKLLEWFEFKEEDHANYFGKYTFVSSELTFLLDLKVLEKQLGATAGEGLSA